MMQTPIARKQPMKEAIMLPPIARKQPGRPPNNDCKKGFNEEKCKKSKVTCSKCRTLGHNKKTFLKFADQA